MDTCEHGAENSAHITEENFAPEQVCLLPFGQLSAPCCDGLNPRPSKTQACLIMCPLIYGKKANYFLT
jgi:hypothetical protein